MSMPFAKDSGGIRTIDDLMQRCTIDELTGCWFLGGRRDPVSPPSVWSPDYRARVSLGMLACLLRTGQRAAPGVVWHCTCETNYCANPMHRRAGTRRSQMLALKITRDPLARARITAGKRAVAKLSEADVQVIRSGGLTLAEIVDRFKISRGYACEVRSGKRRAPIAAPGSSAFAWRPGQ